MIKILTALGNPSLNNELKKYKDFEIIGKDIQYKDGIIEILEINPDINYLIVSEELDGQTSLEELIDLIIKINRKIKIIIILNEKNIDLEENLIRKGIYDILYNNTDLIEIINLLKTKNIEYLNKELRLEIENLKEIILKKNNKKIIFEKINKKNVNNKSCEIIGITGNRGIGKSTFVAILSKSINKKYKILIIDFDLINNNMKSIYEQGKNLKKINELNIKNYILKIQENISLLSDFSLLYYSNNFNYELNKIKNDYDYIIIDTYSEPIFKDNKDILNLCKYLIFLTGSNNLEIQKSKKILNIMNNNWNINNKKIFLVMYKYKNIDLLFFNKFNLKNIFKNINIIGKIKYNHFSNIYLNKNFKKIYINLKLKINCLSILKKINARSDFDE